MRVKKLYFFMVITIITTFVFSDTFSNNVSGQVQPITEVEEKLQDISDVEKAVLEDLFYLSQEIEEMERQKQNIILESERLQNESKKLGEEIDSKQKIYNSQLDILKKVLVSYQRRGPASYLETVLKAENLSDFIQNLNIIREISRNTGKLLNELENSRKELATENEKLIAKEQQLEEYISQLQTTLNDLYVLKEDQESILNSLGEAKEIYQGELQHLQQLWDDIKVLFSEILIHFTKIIERGEFPIEALNLSISFPSVSGALYEQTLNDILQDQPELPEMVFLFSPEGIWVEFPEKQLSLRGVFSIVNQTVLQFEVEEGSFYDMPLTESSLDELFKNGSLIINFNELLGGVILESVEVFDGYLKFVITPDFSQMSGG